MLHEEQAWQACVVQFVFSVLAFVRAVSGLHVCIALVGCYYCHLTKFGTWWWGFSVEQWSVVILFSWFILYHVLTELGPH